MNQVNLNVSKANSLNYLPMFGLDCFSRICVRKYSFAKTNEQWKEKNKTSFAATNCNKNLYNHQAMNQLENTSKPQKRTGYVNCPDLTKVNKITRPFKK